MENVLVATKEKTLLASQIKLEPGQCISKFGLYELGIKPTNIDCFEYNPYLLYSNGRKRYVVQPLPYDQFKLIRIYDYIPAKYS
ncbi:MAG: hypothetical protein JXB17_09945 [Bacteroidales bacterium]|nr:hypothetical protein [Bacteroidales bacterium]